MDKERFKVNDDHKANWALKKIRELKEVKQKKEEFAQKEIDEVKSWLADETSKLDDKISYFEGLLTQYALELKAQDKKLKTKSLPAGKLQFRKQVPKWKYDKDKLLKSVQDAGLKELIKVKKSVDKRKLKQKIEVISSPKSNVCIAMVADTGEILEGIEVVERDEKFKIKV